MNAEGRSSGSFLPDIDPHNNKWKIMTPGTRLKNDSRQKEMESDKVQTLTKEEVAQFRNSVKQSICVEMLCKGYNRSFSEFFSLLRSEEDRIKAAEPGSDLSRQTPLAEQRDKLETMKLHLCKAEEAERTGSWSVVCEQRLSLGLYFSAPEDLLVRLHFLQSCADREQGGFSRAATEARACMAELHLQQGELEQAKLQAEVCLQQAQDGDWLDSAGRTLRLHARKLLWTIHNRLAGAQLAAANYNQALTLLHEGHRMATESEDKHVEAEATYHLGLALQRSGDHHAAKRFFNTYMEICGSLEDADGLGKAHKAMAKSLESEGNITGAVQCLEEMNTISQANGIHHHRADAYLCLGDIYYTLHQYKKACECFLQGFEAACVAGDASLLQKAQVWAARARAVIMVRGYSADVEAATPAALQRLMAWKETRRWQENSDSRTPGHVESPQ